jgi:hypothetical protein
MKRHFLILPYLLLSFFPILGQHTPSGAIGEGLGGITTSLEGKAAAMSNISGLALEQNKSLLLSSSVPFGFYQAMTNQANFIYPFRKGVGLLKFSRFGNHYFNINTLSTGFAHQIDLVKLGLTANCHRYAIQENLNTLVFSLDFGGQAQIYKNLLFGAQISNFRLSAISQSVKNRIETRLALGLKWKTYENLSLYSELGKETGFATETKVGIEYKIGNILQLRTGISTQPNMFHAGTSIKHGAYKLDYAVSNHPILGLSHFLTIGYTFHEKPSS